jgi:phospholipid/cholesterol/gamma-HCH transport system substrate-binding protein
LLRQIDQSKRPTIRNKPNALSSLLLGGGQMLETATEALTRVNRLLSDGNIANLTIAVRDIRSRTNTVALCTPIPRRLQSCCIILPASLGAVDSATASRSRSKSAI